MRILAIGDPHGKLPKDLDKIVKKRRIKIIIVPGEIPPVPTFLYYPKHLRKSPPRDYGEKVYKKLLAKLTSYKLPVIVLKGNSYPMTSQDALIRKILRKHKNVIYKKTGKVKIHDQVFVLFDMIWEKWSYKWLQKDFAHSRHSRSKERIKKFNKIMREAEDPILVSHAPPYGVLDKVPKIGHVGSKVVLKAIKKHKPRYVLCGHIHEGKGKKKIGKTLVINAGSRGDYFVIDLK